MTSFAPLCMCLENFVIKSQKEIHLKKLPLGRRQWERVVIKRDATLGLMGQSLGAWRSGIQRKWLEA